MTPAQRIQNFASAILQRGASELKDPEELVGACVLVIAGSFREGITETEIDAALGRIVAAVKLVTGNTGNIGGKAN